MRPGVSRDACNAYLGHQNDLEFLVMLLEQRVGDVETPEGASQNHHGLGHLAFEQNRD